MILLDTNVVSELMKRTPDPAVERWFLMNEDECHIASVAIGELAYGIAKLDEGARRRTFEDQLVEWRIRFAARTLVFDAAAGMAYGDIMATARRAGRTMSVPDAQLAAIASNQGYALATRNVKDFAAVEITLINPWDV